MMVVVRMELESSPGQSRALVEAFKELNQREDRWPTKGYRVYHTYWSGKIARVVAEGQYESLGEFEAIANKGLANVMADDWPIRPEMFSDIHWSYWTLEDEG